MIKVVPHDVSSVRVGRDAPSVRHAGKYGQESECVNERVG